MKLSWLGILRLGAVQMALGAIVVLMTSTLNRLMIVELGLPAILPGLLVGLHYGVQITRPQWGFLSDTGGRRSFWIVTGMAVLAIGGILAAGAIWLLEVNFTAGLALSVFAYALIGIGVGASGTSLLALLATATDPRRRAAAAMITWLMMVGGIVVTAITVGAILDPYSPERLIRVVVGVTGIALLLTTLAILGLERGLSLDREPDPMPFMTGLKEIWAERQARLFTLFVFLSMSAYFMQELILEPFAGIVFGLSPGESTSLSGAQNGGVFLGMVCVGVACTGLKIGSLRGWVITGCLGSAAALTIICLIGIYPVRAFLVPSVMALGFFNGVFAVAAIGTMMGLAGEGRSAREGTRMGLWGAAQAIAAGLGQISGNAILDILRLFVPEGGTAFAGVFAFEALLFVASAVMAWAIIAAPRRVPSATLVPGE